MAEELMEAVEKLQSRLSDSQEPRKLLKTLKRLGELPITVDILVGTGVGKTVNSLRKHRIVGETARDLVAKWKKLVPQSADSRPSNAKEARSHARPDKARGYKRIRDPSPEQPPPEEDEEEYQQNDSNSSPPQHYSQPYRHRNLEGYQSEEYESPVDEPAASPPQKQTGHSKSHREQAREQGSQSSREQQRQNRPAQVQSEAQIRNNSREQKEILTHASSKRSHQSSIQERRKEKKRVSDGKEKRDKPEPVQIDNEEYSFETPTMSFESFLTYDEPTPSKKKKKLSRPSQPVTSAASVSSKSSKGYEGSVKRPEPSTATVSTPTVPTQEKRKKVIPQIVDAVPTLPDIPLPAIQPNYRPLPSIDVTPLSPQRRKVSIPYEEEDSGFTGRRFNSKMVVYSGSKTPCLPKMMSLYEQCIRVLQNNIDSIDEVGGVPFEILEPVLERCTPEQLYRIEQCNQAFIEESDELWMRHCQRDFKRESLQEYETWRELYLRLQDERDERLRKLTQNISSAHANKPKGRQVKMAYVNSVAKPPRDVRRRQERFGTKNCSTSTSVAAAAPTPVKIRPSMLYSAYSQPSDGGQSSYNSPPEPSHSPVPSSSAGHSSRDKPQVKKIAPMMAKTIKAFKNRFSRR